MKNNFNNVALHSAHVPMINIGDITAADATALAVTDRLYSKAVALAALAAPTAAVYAIPSGNSFINLAFSMNANNSGALCDVYLGWVHTREDAELVRVFSVTITAGQQVSVNGKYLADTLTVSNDNWFSDIYTCNPGTDHLAMLAFDRMGADILVVHCTTLTPYEELSTLVTGV